MSILHSEICQKHTIDYDILRSRMDHNKNIINQLTAITTFENKNIVEFAAGTGTLTRIIAPSTKLIKAFDLSAEMLKMNKEKTQELEKVLPEMECVLISDGTIFILATLGTGAHKPQPLNKLLENLYKFLEHKKGFFGNAMV